MSENTSLAELQEKFNDAHESEIESRAATAPAENGHYWVKMNGLSTYNGIAYITGPVPFRQVRVIDLFGTSWIYGSDGESNEALQVITEWGPPLPFPE